MKPLMLLATLLILLTLVVFVRAVIDPFLRLALQPLTVEVVNLFFFWHAGWWTGKAMRWIEDRQ